MKISRLRLLGFKSFAEPADLVIAPGLTGVVGPNGCGKSNLLEALRWVMGETSHKSMRAAAMDDVIFSGTSSRPPRNVAEVTMFIDNADRKAPAEFNGSDELEITRRIEREAGSAYRINGKDVRARDVKILFEDAATGARSPALVRQGQIAEVVNAKPEQRRRILEDAAGIAGLHSRRHDAELRLKAAETNLARIGDILGGLTSQIESLKRQARQARRYKELSQEIRRSEALLAHLSWQDAQDQVLQLEAGMTETLSKVAQATRAETQAMADETEAAERVPPLREEEGARGAALARIRIEHDNLEREAKRSADREREVSAQIAQLDSDLARETKFIAEAKDILERLETEVEDLSGAEEAADIAEDTGRETLDRLMTELLATEAKLTDITARTAEMRARRNSLENAHTERRDAVARVERHLMGLATQAREVSARAPDALKLVETNAAVERLAAHCVDLEAQTLAAEAKTRDLATDANQKRDEAEQARLSASALSTERQTLARLLVPEQNGKAPPIAEGLGVEAGYEAALGAAFGDDLEAPVGKSAAVHWRLIEVSSKDPSLPADVEPLSRYVEAPPELLRSLKQTGVVSPEDGPRLQPLLKTGQRLVSKQGDLWRWDGFSAAGGSVTPAAQRIAGRNRLRDISKREAEARKIADTFANLQAEMVASLAAAQAEERDLRNRWREAQSELIRSRDALSQIERSAAETENRLRSLAETKAIADDDMMAAVERLTEIETALSFLDEAEDLEPQLRAAQALASHGRDGVSEARARIQTLEREKQLRTARMAAARNEHERWTTRHASSAQQIASLEERLMTSRADHAVLLELPAQIDERRQSLLSELSRAETARKMAADQLAAAETDMKTAAHAIRISQATLASEREALARVETKLEAARARRQDDARRIRETFDVVPEKCLTLAEIEPDKALPSLSDADRNVQRLKSDRERLGAVNLQADEDLTVLQSEFATLNTEKTDVEEAIAKLRTAIQQLNREGKKRLDEAFETVNGHFQKLFTTLFNGGEARLEVIEGDDPLEGGLEIIAKPPGKKPATLSLLSGGEQTLTAMSLIFAVFLTNPSPICVLDEVDAPLDDANTERFCHLLERMAADTNTRFLVITHHPLTMSRMNRLFGVTMAEKGISQLVSVDLETAQSFREVG